MPRFGVLIAIALLASLYVGSALSADKDENKYVGDPEKNCALCHKNQVAAWKKWPMAKAWDRLSADEKKKKECFVCHVTGYGKTGGYVSVDKTPKLVGVQCESCHGPAGNHLKVPLTDKAKKKASMSKPTEDTCKKCHTKAGNPNFKEFKFSEAVKKLADHKNKK
jgi:hypothetical protein